jgi:hypothetical protein
MLGFKGKGTIDIVLDKQTYSFGDTVTGKVRLKLDKPVHAKALVVTIYATEKVYGSGAMGGSLVMGAAMSRNPMAMMNTGMRQTKETLYNFKLNLDSEKEYGTEPLEYPFELKIPANNSNVQPAQQGNAAPGGAAVSMLSNPMSQMMFQTGIAMWYIKAELDIPLSLGVSKTVQLNVG